VKRPVRRTAGASVRILSDAQRDELTLGFGLLGGRSSAFPSVEVARAAWTAHKDAIMGSWGTPFRRPRGWWLFEVGEAPGDQLARLAELDALVPAEFAVLPGAVSADGVREVLLRPALPDRVLRLLAADPRLGSGLTARGWTAFLDALPPAAYAAVLQHHGADAPTNRTLP